MLAIVIFALNGYVTRATSLDPLENVEIDETKTDRDDSRPKRSGNIFSSLLKKKLGLLGSLSGTSSGKSIGHSAENFPEHFEEPLVCHVCKLFIKIKSNVRVLNIHLTLTIIVNVLFMKSQHESIYCILVLPHKIVQFVGH